MKRKRGVAKPKPKKKPSLVGETEAIPKVVGLNDDHSLNGLFSEYDAIESETPEDEMMMNDHQAALEQVVANTVNSMRNTSTAVLGNLSKFAASTPTKSARGADSYAGCDSRMGTTTPRAETNMNGRQTDSEKGGAAVNGMMGFCPNALREMIISIMSDLSKEPGGITAKLSSGIAHNPISNPPVFHPRGERTRQEVAPTQNPQYKEQELNASLSVIKKIMKLDAAEPFCVPVDPIALGIPDYFDVIDTPMDFGTICYNLENGYKYIDSEDVYKDVQHIWDNCSKYNKTGDYILELMKRVKTTFMKYWTAAGLHTECDRATNGSTIMGSIQRKRSTVRNVPDKAGASHAQRNQPSSIFKRGYQPHLSSNEPNFCLESAGVNISGYSNVPLPTEPNMSHSMRRHYHPVVPVSDKTRLSQARLYKPSAIDNQPQLSSNQRQPSQWHTEVNTSTAGYSRLNFPTESAMRHNTRSPERPVGAVADSAGPSQVQFHEGSTRDNRLQLSSDQPHQQVDLDTSGFSHSPPRDSSTRPNNRGKECQVTPENLIHQQNNVGSYKEQYYQSPLLYGPPSFPQQDNANRELAGPQNKRNGRGPTRCLKLLTAVGRIPVSINELGQPIGPETVQLTSFLGLMARDGNLAPLTYPSWQKLPKENKEDMWEKVQSRFDIDPASKTWVLKSISNKWRNFKAILKTNHYDTHSTDAERLADRDTRVLPDQWSILVSQWNSEKWQEMSAKNKAIRANLKFSHASGKKSYARIREEEKAKRPDGKEPSRAELFILTRTRKDGKPVNEATAAVISQLRDLTAQQPDTTENNDEPQGDILAQVLGPDKKGRVRCLELGSTPTVVGPQNPSRADAMKMVSEANAKVYEMNEKMASMEQMCAQMAAQMSTMVSMMTSKSNSQNKRTSIVVAETSDDSEELPQQSVHTSTSRRAVPPRQASDDSEKLPQQSVHTSTSRRVVPPRHAKEKQARKRK